MLGWRATQRRSDSLEFWLLTSSDVLGGLAFEANGRLQRRAQLSATQDAVTRTLGWSDVRMVPTRVRDTSPPDGRQAPCAYMRGNTRSRDGRNVIFGLAEALRPDAFITSPVSRCPFRRDCTYTSRHARVVSQASGQEMRRWLRRRRERSERIETEADELVRLLGDRRLPGGALARTHRQLLGQCPRMESDRIGDCAPNRKAHRSRQTSCGRPLKG